MEKVLTENPHDSASAKTCSAGVPIAQRGSADGGSCLGLEGGGRCVLCYGGQLGFWLRHGSICLPKARLLRASSALLELLSKCTGLPFRCPRTKVVVFHEKYNFKEWTK